MEASQPPEPPAGRPSLTPSFFFTPDGWPYLLVPFIPLAVALELAHAAAGLIFFSAALGVIPTAALMGRATEEVAARSGPGIGGLLNVTFGNAPELIIALFALEAGLHEVVKASIIGSILGNILLVMGAAMLAGGLTGGRKVQRFDRTAANVQSLMLFLAAAALVMPAIFELVEGQGLPGIDAGAGRLRRHGRGPLARRRDRPDRDLRGGAAVQPPHPHASSSTPTATTTRRTTTPGAGRSGPR